MCMHCDVVTATERNITEQFAVHQPIQRLSYKTSEQQYSSDSHWIELNLPNATRAVSACPSAACASIKEVPLASLLETKAEPRLCRLAADWQRGLLDCDLVLGIVRACLRVWSIRGWLPVWSMVSRVCRVSSIPLLQIVSLEASVSDVSSTSWRGTHSCLLLTSWMQSAGKKLSYSFLSPSQWTYITIDINTLCLNHWYQYPLILENITHISVPWQDPMCDL